MKKKLIIGFITGFVLFLYLKKEKSQVQDSFSSDQIETVDVSPLVAAKELLPPSNHSPISEVKKDYINPDQFESVEDALKYHFKHSDHSLDSVSLKEKSIEVIFEENLEQEKNLDSFLYNLNVDLTRLKEDYRAYFDEESNSVKIQLLDDYLTMISEKIKEKSKNLTKVELTYTTPLEIKSLSCLKGDEYIKNADFYAKNNCIYHSIHSVKAYELISQFYKSATPPENFNKVQSEVIPLWGEFYGKNEDLILANQHLFFCLPNEQTIWVNIGCNFRLTIKKHL